MSRVSAERDRQESGRRPTMIWISARARRRRPRRTRPRQRFCRERPRSALADVDPRARAVVAAARPTRVARRRRADARSGGDEVDVARRQRQAVRFANVEQVMTSVGIARSPAIWPTNRTSGATRRRRRPIRRPESRRGWATTVATPAEVAGSGGALERLGDRADATRWGRSRRLDSSAWRQTRSSPIIDRRARGRGADRGKALVVGGPVELARVDEDRRDRRARSGAGRPHQRALAGPERAVRRHEAERPRGGRRALHGAGRSMWSSSRRVVPSAQETYHIGQRARPRSPHADGGAGYSPFWSSARGDPRAGRQAEHRCRLSDAGRRGSSRSAGGHTGARYRSARSRDDVGEESHVRGPQDRRGCTMPTPRSAISSRAVRSRPARGLLDRFGPGRTRVQ